MTDTCIRYVCHAAGVTTGAELRAERIAAEVQGAAVAAFFGKDPAYVTRLEQREEVDDLTVRRYRRAVAAGRMVRTAVRRQLLRELAAL